MLQKTRVEKKLNLCEEQKAVLGYVCDVLLEIYATLMKERNAAGLVPKKELKASREHVLVLETNKIACGPDPRRLLSARERQTGMKIELGYALDETDFKHIIY